MGGSIRYLVAKYDQIVMSQFSIKMLFLRRMFRSLREYETAMHRLIH